MFIRLVATQIFFLQIEFNTEIQMNRVVSENAWLIHKISSVAVR